ncbi:MAG: tetratricopeptide repeat protein [Alloacidobacterium sp.]
MSEEETVRILRRDVLLLSILGVCAVGLFLLTRAVAAREGAIESRVAETWYQDGLRKFHAGAIDGAIESFRKSTAIDRENRTYVLALADSLAAGNHNTQAKQALLRLRESDPTNAEVNLHLARLAVKTGNAPDAVIYYHGALDGLWTGPDIAERRRNVREELIHFLIERHDENRVLSELLVLDSELPDSADLHVEAGKLFLKADDSKHALNDFSEAIRLDPHNVEALAGAGEAEFRLGDYRKARHYLEEATEQGETSAETAQMLSLARMVTSYDPLALGLTAKERQRRLSASLDQATQRLDECRSKASTPDLEALKGDAEAMQGEINSTKGFHDPGLISSGLGLIYRIEDAVNARCGPATGADEALLLIGRKHGDTQ